LRNSLDEVNFSSMAQKPAKTLPALRRGDARAGTSGCFDAIKVTSVAGCHAQAGPGQAVAHYLDRYFVADYSAKAVFCAGGTHTSDKTNLPPVGARLAANGQHDIMEFQNAAGARSGSDRRQFCVPKISENLCGVFNILCYIPALLTNQS
jgi:hypothetical protein